MRRISTRRSILWGVIISIMFCAPAMAELGYTDWLENGEPTMLTILEGIYGGTWENGGPDYTNGDISVYRVYDFDDLDESLHIVNGDQGDIDQIWTDGIATVTAQAKYASLSQSFGWNQGGTDPCNYQELLYYDGPSGVIEGGPVVEIEIEGDFLWGIQPNSDEWWSKMSLNENGGMDHLITFFVDGASLNGERVWLLFWEDLPSTGWDQDYQDFVIEVRAEVPEPASMLLFGIGGLALLRKHRK